MALIKPDLGRKWWKASPAWVVKTSWSFSWFQLLFLSVTSESHPQKFSRQSSYIICLRFFFSDFFFLWTLGIYCTFYSFSIDYFSFFPVCNCYSLILRCFEGLFHTVLPCSVFFQIFHSLFPTFSLLHIFLPISSTLLLLLSCFSRVWLCNPMDCSRLGSSVASPGKNTGVGCHFFLQEIFPTKGPNPCLLCLLHWQADSL